MERANGTVISVPTGWNGKSGVPPMVVCLFQKIPFDPRISFAFQPVEPEILAKWKAPQASLHLFAIERKTGARGLMGQRYQFHNSPRTSVDRGATLTSSPGSGLGNPRWRGPSAAPSRSRAFLDRPTQRPWGRGWVRRQGRRQFG